MDEHHHSPPRSAPHAAADPVPPVAGRKLHAMLLRCYPAPWRARYGSELADLLAAEPASPRLVFDLLRGALDAHLHPQYPIRRTGHVRRVFTLALLAVLLLVGGYVARHPATATSFQTLVSAPQHPQIVATATPGEHGYNQRGGRPE